MSRRSSDEVRPTVWLMLAATVAIAAFAFYEAHEITQDAAAPEVELDASTRRARGRHGPADRRSVDRSAGPTSTSSSGGGYQHHDWGAESELNRALALGLPTHDFWQSPDARTRMQNDPQLIAMWRSFHGRRPSETEDPELPFEPTGHRLQLLDAEGDVASSPTTCDVRVLPVSAYGFNCVVRVMCDGEVLYPDDRQRAGYVRCELGDDGQIVRAVDSGQTSGDGDPLVDLNFEDGTITVEDYSTEGERSYRATLRIQS